VNRAIRFIETSCSKDSIILMVSNKMFKIKRTTLICRLLKSSQLGLTAKKALKDLSLRILNSYKNWSQCGRRHSVLRKLLLIKLIMPAKSKMKRSARYREVRLRSELQKGQKTKKTNNWVTN
jgi:type II restriction/modification system DNA methylase subunit YeeA